MIRHHDQVDYFVWRRWRRVTRKKLSLLTCVITNCTVTPLLVRIQVRQLFRYTAVVELIWIATINKEPG
jgi:hypothetical protein